MWDLGTMEIMNAKYVAEERRRLAEEAIEDKAIGLIEQIFQTLSNVPPLHHLLAMVKCSDNLEHFRVLVHEFVPEHEIEIMSKKDDTDKAQLFMKYFGKKYFWLDDTGEYLLEDITYMIPVSQHGLEDDEYRDFTQNDPTKAVLSYIVEYPYHYEKDKGEGHREALYDFILTNQLASQADLDNVPKDGWTFDEISKALDGGKYIGLVAFAAWVTRSTGTWVLDCTMDDELEPAPWSRDTVEFITEQFKEATRILDDISKLEKWMKEDPAGNFGRLVDAIRGKVRRRRPKVKQKTLFEVFKEQHPEEADKLEHPIQIEV